MSAPPKYPRIPHLVWREGMDADDRLLTAEARDALLARPVIVEEKLDGANICLWFDDGLLQVATRGGPGAADRAGHRGRVRAWASQRTDTLRAVLGDRFALYGEWLLRRHRVRYDRLPSPLVGLDVFDRQRERFVDIADRDDVLRSVGVPGPPRLASGRLAGPEELAQLSGISAFGSEPAEGLIIRADGDGDPAPRIAKVLSRDARPALGRDATDENLMLG